MSHFKAEMHQCTVCLCPFVCLCLIRNLTLNFSVDSELDMRRVHALVGQFESWICSLSVGGFGSDALIAKLQYTCKHLRIIE